MQLLKNQGSFEILTPLEFLKMQGELIEKAGRTCYQSESDQVSEESARKFIKMLIRRGHLSVIEHSLLTVKFKNCSRGFTHEQVRHRLTAISQESTRYVDYAKRGADEADLENFQCKFIAPPHRDENQKVLLADGREMSMAEMFEQVEMFYRGLRKAGWKPEDARQILPIGLKAEIVISANLREWRHIFFMRTSKFAHWEIRKVMCDLLEELQKILPVVFDDFVEAGVDSNGQRYFEQRELA